MLLNSLRVQYPPTLSHQSYPLPPTQTKKKIRSASKLQIGLQVSSLLLFLPRGFCWWDILLPCVTQQFHEQHFKKKGGLGEGRDGPLAILKCAVDHLMDLRQWYYDRNRWKVHYYYFLRRQIGSSIIWASRRQAIMDNGTQEYPYVFWVNQSIKTLFCHGNAIRFKKKQMTAR